MVISTSRLICDTSSNILDDIGFRKVHYGGLRDSSYFALNTTGRKTDIANNNFSNFKILNKLGKLQGYSEPQTAQNFILDELNQLSIEDWRFRPDIKFQFDFIDTSSDNLEQAKSSELEDIITDECMKFCNSHGLMPTLRSCLNQVEAIFSNIEKYYAETCYFHDNETEDSKHVVIRLEVKSDKETVSDEYDRWVDWLAENLLFDKSRFFTLTIKRI